MKDVYAYGRIPPPPDDGGQQKANVGGAILAAMIWMGAWWLRGSGSLATAAHAQVHTSTWSRRRAERARLYRRTRSDNTRWGRRECAGNAQAPRHGVDEQAFETARFCWSLHMPSSDPKDAERVRAARESMMDYAKGGCLASTVRHHYSWVSGNSLAY